MRIEEKAQTAHLLHAGVVDESGVGTGAGDDESGSEETSRLLQLIVIYRTRFWLHQRQHGGVTQSKDTGIITR